VKRQPKDMCGRDALLALLEGKCVRREDFLPRLYLGIDVHSMHTRWGWIGHLKFCDGSLFEHNFDDFLVDKHMWRVVADTKRAFAAFGGEIETPRHRISSSDAIRAMLMGEYVQETRTGYIYFFHDGRLRLLDQAISPELSVNQFLANRQWNVVARRMQTCPVCHSDVFVYLHRDPTAVWDDKSGDQWLPGKHKSPIRPYALCPGGQEPVNSKPEACCT
jgi:hypothetical protein